MGMKNGGEAEKTNDAETGVNAKNNRQTQTIKRRRLMLPLLKTPSFRMVLIEVVVNNVSMFFQTGYIPIGCNASFITLISKVDNPVAVKDYRPLSLTGLQYKVIAKLLTNRLTQVIDSVISVEQSGFVKGRQILDGPLMVNEIISWCKKRRKRLMMFKVDFEKAYDSICNPRDDGDGGRDP
ncbi:hypothetical protein LXL04_020783 [Taraxacum kok-saghyz]